MNKYYKLIYIILPILLTFTYCKKNKNDTTETEETNITEGNFEYGIRIDTLDIDEYHVKSGDNLSLIFNNLGFSASYSDTIVQASKGILDPQKLQVGKKYITLTTQNSIAEIKYIIFEKSNTDFSVVDFTTKPVSAYEFCKEIKLETCYTEGEITSSLWNAIADSGNDPLLALKLSDIYAWQIDFFDIKKHDKFQVVYDMAYVDDTIPLYIADIKSAIFTHQGTEFKAIPFEQDSIMEFFDGEGNSLRKAFLKTPVKFDRISSRFSNSRFHPVLKRYRAHHGVDYVAPTGTPVRTIGDGVVIAKAYQKSGGGYYMKVKHNSTYTTTYMHLSKFAKGIAVGKHVKQGDVIAYVGSTGLSTGPHLDFRVHKNGQPIDPLKMESPPALPIKPELMDSFNIIKQNILDDLKERSIQFNLKSNNDSIQQLL